MLINESRMCKGLSGASQNAKTCHDHICEFWLLAHKADRSSNKDMMSKGSSKMEERCARRSDERRVLTIIALIGKT